MTSTTATATVTTTVAGTATATATAMDRRTYWCHECDMSISLISTTTTSCPHCTSNFLEELDSPISLNNPHFNRVMNHLLNSDYSNYNHFATGTTSGNLGVSKSVIDGINRVKITAALLEIDPVVICAVCKDQFVIDDETKELPCKHLYHPDCIIPWLTLRNSCPVCRFEMLVEPVVDSELNVRRRSRSFRVLRLLNLNNNNYNNISDNDNDNDNDTDDDVDDDHNDGGDEEELLGFGLRHCTRRHRILFPVMRNNHRFGERNVEVETEVLFSPSQIGGEVEVGDSGPTDSIETVSSWPNWPVDGGEVVVSGASVNDDADLVML